MKKKHGKQLIALLVALVMALTPVIASAEAFGVDYNYDDPSNPNLRTGIKSVIIDDTTYYDLFSGSRDRTSTNVKYDFLRSVLTSSAGSEDGTSLLEYWSNLAYAIYAAEGDYSCVDDIADFSSTSANNSKAGYANLPVDLARGLNEGDTWGETRRDYTSVVGLSLASNPSAVRDKAAQSVADALTSKNGMTGEWLLGEVKDLYGSDILSNLMDDSDNTTLYTMVTYLQERNSVHTLWHYGVFGLTFSDFEFHIISDDNLSYITAAEGYSSLEDAYVNNVPGVKYSSSNVSGDDPDVVSYFRNNAADEAEIGMEFTNTNSMTVSNSMESTEQYTYSEMVGSETKVGISFLADAEETLKMEFTAEQALSTAYSEETSVTNETSSTVTENITLPAQSAVAIATSSDKTSFVLDYDCPIYVSYKVNVFSMSGDIYNGPATKTIKDGNYWSRFFQTTFGTNSTSGGTDAISNLHNRAITYGEDSSYEETWGQTTGWAKKMGKNPTSTSIVDWSDVLNGRTIQEEDLDRDTMTLKVRACAVDEDGNRLYDGDGNEIILQEREDSCYEGYETVARMGSSLSIASGDYAGEYEIYDGPVFIGEGDDAEDNNADLEYESSTGTYYKVTRPYNDPENEMDVVRFFYTKVESNDINPASVAAEDDFSVETLDTADTPQTIADDDPTVADRVIWLCSNIPMSITGATISADTDSLYQEISEIEAIYPLDYISLTSGQKTFELLSGDTLNTDNITVDGYNANHVPYYGFDQDLGGWALVDEDDNELVDSPIATLETDNKTGEVLLVAGEEEGTVYLKYMIDENAANYTCVNSSTAVTNSDLSDTAEVKVNVTNQPFTGSVEASGSLTAYVDEPVNLDDCEELKTTVWDETGVKIPGAYVTWQAQLSAEDGITLENNKLTFTEEAANKEFLIRATYGKGGTTAYSDWITVTVLPKKAINEIVISDETDPATLEPMILNDSDNQICLDNLTVTAFDQYGFDWNDLGNLTWYVDDEKIESDGDFTIYTASEPGEHTIYAECDGVVSNTLTLTVLLERSKSDGITLSDEELTLKEGKSAKLTPSLSPDYSEDSITWTSSKPSIATVDQNGKVTAIAVGNTTITAKTGSGLSAKCKVHVALVEGDTYTKGNYDIKVTNDKLNGKGSVEITGLEKAKKKVTIPETVTVNGIDYKVTGISDRAFKGDKKITSVNTGKNVTKIGKGAFRNCKNLKTVVIGDKVEKIGYKAFFNDKKMTKVTIGKNVTTIGAHAFCEDKNLEKITINSKKLTKVGSPHAFIHDDKATVKVPASKLKAYRKLLSKRGLSKAAIKKK